MASTAAPWLPPRESRVVAAAAVAALALGWGAGAAVALLPSAPGIALDAAARDLLEPLRSVPAAEIVAEVLAVVGEQPVSVIVGVGVAAAVLIRYGPAAGLTVGAASAASAGHVILMKWLVHRPGPGMSVVGALGSFPSGHAANAALLGVLGGLLVRRPWMWVLGAAYTAAVAASRVVLAAHWLTDTLAGVLEGAAVAALAWAVGGRLVGRICGGHARA